MDKLVWMSWWVVIFLAVVGPVVIACSYQICVTLNKILGVLEEIKRYAVK